MPHNIEKKLPLISVLICHEDQPIYLEQALRSLWRQTYQNFEIVLVDNGSTSMAARDFLDKLEADFTARQWPFIRLPKGHPSIAINIAAQNASGGYIKMMDVRNIAKHHELDVFQKVGLKTNADVFNCIFDRFSGDTAPKEDQQPEERWVLVGPSIAVGAFQNSFGEHSFMVRKDVFLKLGGFRQDPGVGHLHWEFLARAVLNGHSFEMIPEPLFWQRIDLRPQTPQPMRTYADYMLSMKPYLDQMRPELRPILLLANGLMRHPVPFQKTFRTNTEPANKLIKRARLAIKSLLGL